MWLFFVGLGILILAGIPYLVFYVMSVRIKPDEFSRPEAEDVVPVSVLVPTYNEEAIVVDTMERLCELQYPDEALEIVFVDSSEDRTAEYVREFFEQRTKPDLILIEEEDRGGVARAVNRGVSAASHEIIFRTDCDAKLDSRAVKQAVSSLQDPDVGGVTGRQVEILGDSSVEKSYRSMQARNQALETALDSVFMVHGPCFAFRRDLFQPLPADTVADDTEIAIRIRKAGKRVVMNPGMQFAEVGVSDIRARRGRKDRRAVGLLQVLWRHRDVLGRHGRYGRVVVPFNWWFLFISPWLSMAGLTLFLVGGIIAFGVIGGLLAVAVVGFVLLGHKDLLGPIRDLYTVFDAHISLVIATVSLVSGRASGTWEQDVESREMLEGES